MADDFKGVGPEIFIPLDQSMADEPSPSNPKLDPPPVIDPQSRKINFRGAGPETGTLNQHIDSSSVWSAADVDVASFEVR